MVNSAHYHFRLRNWLHLDLLVLFSIAVTVGLRYVVCLAVPSSPWHIFQSLIFFKCQLEKKFIVQGLFIWVAYFPTFYFL